MFVNLTPHNVVLQGADGARLVVQAMAGVVCRISTTPGELITMVWQGDESESGIKLYDRTTWGEPFGLPDPSPGVIYIVSALFAGRVGDRGDVYYPGTGPADGAIRDEKGQVVAVTGRVRHARRVPRFTIDRRGAALVPRGSRRPSNPPSIASAPIASV